MYYVLAIIMSLSSASSDVSLGKWLFGPIHIIPAARSRRHRLPSLCLPLPLPLARKSAAAVSSCGQRSAAAVSSTQHTAGHTVHTAH
jgi:hypothetical protein